MSEQRIRGTVKWYNVEKRYGFIRGDDDMDHFVHVSELKAAGIQTLNEGQAVEFEIEMNPLTKKPAACKLVLV